MKNIRYIIFLSICFVLMASCRTRREIVEVPIEVPKIETRYINKTDSIILRDSIHHYVYSKSDTVFSEIVKYRYKYLVKRDTIVVRDSIYKTQYLTKNVEKKIKYVPWYLKSLAWIGAAALVLMAIKLKFKF